jgi:hypothetical protein
MACLKIITFFTYHFLSCQIFYLYLFKIKASAALEEDGPFDFRSLLRKTDILPTDTLKKCRLRNIPCLTQR